MNENIHQEANKVDVENEEQKTCRICFGEESFLDKFIYPCSCNGSIKYVHESCLKTYLISKNPNQQNSLQKRSTSHQKCDVCKKDFQVYWNRIYSAKSCNEIFKNEKIPLFFILMAIGMLIGTIYVFVKVRGDMDDEDDDVYKDTIVGMITVLCVLSFIFVFTCSIYTVLKCLFKRTVTISKIQPLKRPNVQKEVVPLDQL